MRTFFYTLMILGILAIPRHHNAYAQEDAAQNDEEAAYGWRNQVVGSLNLTQAQFDNWSQGGENTLAWQLNFNASFILDQETFNWSTTNKISYGQAKVGDLESRKSADEFRLETVYTQILGEYVNPYASGLLQTQMTRGYQYVGDERFAISNLFDPGYVTLSVGVGYEPTPYLKTRLGAATKTTITREYAVGLTDDPATDRVEKIDTEFGALSVTEIRRPLAENILLTSKLDLFSNLASFREVDVRWDTIISAKVSRLVDVSLNVELLYDSNISPKRQLKQLLSLGLSYTFL
jgi:hypothetical protein